MRQIPCSRTPGKLLRRQAACEMFSRGRKELFLAYPLKQFAIQADVSDPWVEIASCSLIHRCGLGDYGRPRFGVLPRGCRKHEERHERAEGDRINHTRNGASERRNIRLVKMMGILRSTRRLPTVGSIKQDVDLTGRACYLDCAR